jgi:hypothetical protein
MYLLHITMKLYRLSPNTWRVAKEQIVLITMSLAIANLTNNLMHTQAFY